MKTLNIKKKESFCLDLNPSDIVFLSCCLDNFFYLLGDMLNT